MTTTQTEVDGRPANVVTAAQDTMIENTIENLVTDLVREMDERDRRAVAAARAAERVKESKQKIQGLEDEIRRLKRAKGQQHLAEVANEEAFGEDEETDEGEDEEFDGEE